MHGFTQSAMTRRDLSYLLFEPEYNWKEQPKQLADRRPRDRFPDRLPSPRTKTLAADGYRRTLRLSLLPYQLGQAPRRGEQPSCGHLRDGLRAPCEFRFRACADEPRRTLLRR